MTETLETVTKKKPEPTAEQAAAEELVRQAREQGLSLTGPDGLLKQLTKVVIETALDQELTEHLGHEKNTPAGNETGNVRNGARPKTVLTEGTGQVGIEVPRDRDGTFEPQIVKKRQRRLGGVDEIILSLYAKGLTTGEISAHFAEIYGASVSQGDRLPDHRPGDRGDAVLAGAAAGRGLRGRVHRRDRGQGPRRAGRQPARLRRDRGHPGQRERHSRAVGRDRRGGRQVLDERADRPAQPRDQGRVLRRLRRPQGAARRGVNVWPQAIVQTCIVHLIRNTFRLTSKRDWDAMKRDVKLIYTAVNAAAARAALDELAGKWGRQYGAVIRLWESAWEQFIPFLDYDPEIRTVICSTQRDRVAQRPLPAGRQGPGALPDRAGRDQVPLPRHPVP